MVFLKLSRNDVVRHQSNVTVKDVHDTEVLSSGVTPTQLLPGACVQNMIRPYVHVHNPLIGFIFFRNKSVKCHSRRFVSL